MDKEYNYGKAFLSVGCNRDLFLSNLYQFVSFQLDNDVIDEMALYLCSFSTDHIKVLHKNILQRREIEKHVWIESEKHKQDMKIQATQDWVMKYAQPFSRWYEKEYGNKFNNLFANNQQFEMTLSSNNKKVLG
jgi:hypothetical protein